MKKKLFITCLLAFIALSMSAQQEKKWYDTFKLSGYGMLQFQTEDKEGGEHNEFNLRLLRMILDGKIGEFDWRAQIQGTNAKGPGEPTVQLVDLYTEWVKHPEAKIRVGQFKRPFTFENPTHPITQGWYAYADVINRLSGFGDRAGEKSSGGRDIGIQLQGDLFPASDGHRFLHYQVGVFNGEGINTKDKDQRKDIIGGMWVVPVKGLRIGAFGWTGSHGKMVCKDEVGNDKIGSLPLNRYCLSAEWDKDEYTFRTEYVHSQGWAATGIGSNVVDYSKGDKADGWYVFGIVPVIKSKLHAKARYQCYRPTKDMDASKSMYEVGVNYFISKNMEITAEYARVNDRSIANHDNQNYNFVDVELDFRF